MHLLHIYMYRQINRVIIELCLILQVRGLLETIYYINVHEAILVFDSN